MSCVFGLRWCLRLALTPFLFHYEVKDKQHKHQVMIPSRFTFTRFHRFRQASPFSSFSSIFNPTEDHSQLRCTLRDFVKHEIEPQALVHNRDETFNRPLFTKMAQELGILGITLPLEYGGCGLSYPATASCIAHEELSYSDPAFCLSYLAHSILLVHNLYVNASSDTQRHQFLPNLCSGTLIGGMGMSESHGGTDVLGQMKSYATFHPQNQVWILCGTKMWITNGVMNDISNKHIRTTGDAFLVYARTGPTKTHVTQFLVEKGMKGFYVGQHIQQKLGMRASPTAELVMDHVPIPSTHVVGQVDQAIHCMMRNLEIERLSLAAMAIGIARRCIDEMIQYTKTRKAFNQTIIDFGQIQKSIAESYAEYMAAKCYVYSLANSIHQVHHCDNTLDADGVKLFAAQMAKNVADRAIQCMGGYGYVGEYVVERMWRDAKLLEIGGGTNESHHKNMIRMFKKNSQPLP